MSNRGTVRNASFISNSSGNSPAKKKEKVDVDTYSSVLARPPNAIPDRAGAGEAPAEHRGSDQCDESPPAWFVAFEKRQESRFQSLLQECRDEHQTFRFEMDTMKDEIKALSTALDEASLKIDDLENRSRRNNLVIWGAPEGIESQDCISFIHNLLGEDGHSSTTIQRAHRSGYLSSKPGSKPNKKPRPIHIGFSSYLAKVDAKKKLISVFKESTYSAGGVKDARLYVSDDFSRKVQQMRKDKMPLLKELRSKGTQAFMIYPATIKVRDPAGRLVDP